MGEETDLSCAKDNDAFNLAEMELDLTFDIGDQRTNSDPLNSSSFCVLRDEIIQAPNQLNDSMNISLIREAKSALFDTLSLRSNTDGQVAMASINSSNDEIRLNPVSDNGDNRNEETSNNSAQVVYTSDDDCLGKKGKKYY